MTDAKFKRQVKAISKHNRDVIVNLKSKYTAIHKLFVKHPELRRTLLLIWDYVKQNGGFNYNGEVCFILTAKDLTALRQRNTAHLAVTSRYMNYLTAIGLLTKVRQVMDYETGEEELTEINKEFILKSPLQSKPMNTYKIEKYKTSLLKRVEQNIEELTACNVKPSNISNDRLTHKQHSNVAERVYFNNKSGYVEKLENYHKLINHIERQIKKCGYTTKYHATTHIKGLGRVKADETFKFFKDELLNVYSYKPPNKEEREKYNLANNKYIILRKDVKK